MADSAPESSAHSNKTLMSLTPGASANSKNQASLSRLQSPWFQRFVQANAGPLSVSPLSVSPRRLTVEKVVLSKETQQNLALHKCDHENDAFVGSGSTIALDGFSLQLGCTEEGEKRAKGGSGKIETIKLSGCMQNETVTGVGDLKENRASEIADAKLGDEASTFPIVGSFNSHSREISDELQSSSLVVERSGDPSAQVYVLPRTEQQFCSQYRNSERVTFSGIETQNNKIETTSTIPSENSVSAFRAIPISMRKPPLPPGVMTRMKGGAPLQPNKAGCHDTKLNFGKRRKPSGSAIDKVIPGAKFDKEVCAKRGNSYSFYNKTNNKGAGEGLTAKFGIFDKVASAAINPMVELATFPEGIQSAYTESSLQVKSSYQQGFTAFRNDIMRKSTGRLRISEIDSKMVSNLNDRGKPFQHPTQGMTGKVHLQSFFEGQGKRTEEFTLGESLRNNDGSALQVTKESSQKGPGTMLGADIEAILPSQYGDCSSSKTEGLLPENSIAWHPSPRASTLEYQHIYTDLHSSKRPRKTLHRDETMLDSFHSEKVVAQCSGGAKGSKDPEDIQLHNRAELTEASVDAMEYKRFNPCEKDSREQRHGLRHVSNQEDVSPSCLGEHPRHSDHLASSSLVKYTGLLNTPVEQNIVGSMEHSPQNITLQTRVNYPGRGTSSSSQKKIDMASVLALPWIQRWCPSYQNKSSLFETHCGSAATRGINLRSFSVKRLPSAAAMAIVGIASRQLQPCKWQKLGSSRV